MKTPQKTGRIPGTDDYCLIRKRNQALRGLLFFSDSAIHTEESRNFEELEFLSLLSGSC